MGERYSVDFEIDGFTFSSTRFSLSKEEAETLAAKILAAMPNSKARAFDNAGCD